MEPWIQVTDLNDPSAPLAEEAIKSASFILWSLSGRKFNGPTTVTEDYDTPCSPYPRPLTRSLPYMEDYGATYQQWSSQLGYLPAAPDCECGLTRLRLRHRPVLEVTSVTLENGDELDPSLWHVYDRAYLGPSSGQSWSLCGRLTVSYTYGALPPSSGVQACRVLANELVKAYCGDAAGCALPKRVTTITRQGMSMTLLDPQTFLKEGRTGVYEIDLFLRAVNPYGATKPARVFSPDRPRARRRSSP